MISMRIIHPHKIKLEKKFESVIIPGIDGDFTVLKGHTPFITRLRSGILSTFVGSPQKKQDYAIHDGFVTVENDEVVIVCDRVESKDEVDAKRAEKSKKRAQKRLAAEAASDVDFRRAEFALKRSLSRLILSGDE